SRHRSSYHNLNDHNHELLVLRQVVRKPTLLRPPTGCEESRPKANRSKRNHLLQQDWKHCLFRPGIRVLSALIAL
ncbi:MAG: hypothetical protein K2P54_04050, partial [Odoribacter sp.]|nr:hypothetical protein [Odoribacter sp.]